MKEAQLVVLNRVGLVVVKTERVWVICPACGQPVEAVASDGQVKGYCAVARQSVSFLAETQLENYRRNPEYRAKLSAAQSRLWQDPEYRVMQSAAQRRRWQDPEYRAKMSTAEIRHWQDPEYRTKQSAAHKRPSPSDESRAKLSAALKKRWQDPEYRAKMSTDQRRRWQDPEYRATQSAAIQAAHKKGESGQPPGMR